MQAPFHYLLFMLSALLGQEMTVIGESCVVNVDRQESVVTIELIDLMANESELEAVNEFIGSLTDSTDFPDQGSFIINDISLKRQGNKSNAIIKFSYSDESSFFQEFGFFKTPEGDVLFHPLSNEDVKSTNGTKTVFEDLDVIKWQNGDNIQMNLILSDSKEFRQLLQDYYGNLVRIGGK
ncbi:MAG: hypothetical protein NXI20_27750 [bacterium]|nr:hypothetical protein [bacterium]